MPQSKATTRDSIWSRVFAAIVGTFGEAWGELRTHKLRVILSLIGIAVAVAALTAVVGLGELQKQATLENNERWGGRIATLRIDTFTEDGSPVDWKAADERFSAVNERYGFTHTTRLIDGQVQVPAQLPEGVTMIPSKQYDPAYPIIHRAKLQEGRWFSADDAELLAPPIVVSAPLCEKLGSPPLDTHPTLGMTAAFTGSYQIVGVLQKAGEWDQELRIDMLYCSYVQREDAVPKEVLVSREIWVSGNKAAEIGPVLAM